jgi:CRP/FNR family transcriptional regulator, anaerobic regulatory protein
MLAHDISIEALNKLKIHQNQPVALRHLVAGQSLFYEGDAPTHLYEIVSGVVKVSKCTAGGKSLVLDFLLPGDVIGLTLADGYAYDAVAIEPVTLRCVSRQRLEADLVHDSNAAKQLLGWACHEIEALQVHLMQLSLLDPRGRLAAFLCRMVTRQGGKADIHLPMTQRDMAEHLALTPETICRVLRQFRISGWITMPSCHKLTIHNLAALEHLANDDDSY